MLSAWIVDIDRLKIKGSVIKNTRAMLLDAQGRVIISCQMVQGHDPVIAIPSIKPGIYLMVIQDNGFTESLKPANIFFLKW